VAKAGDYWMVVATGNEGRISDGHANLVRVHKMYTKGLISRFLRFLHRAKSEIGGYFSCSLAFAAYDFYHQQRGLPQGGGVAPLVAPLRGNVDLLGLLHVADVPGRHAPGTGVMDYTAIYRGLRREGYRGWIAMEFLPTGDAAAELRKAAAEVPSRTVSVSSAVAAAAEGMVEAMRNDHQRAAKTSDHDLDAV
jgi:hypothetical protein